MKSIPKFIVCLLVCFGAGAIGGVFTASSVGTWYAQLLKPALSPPNWVFAPVWNFLYLLMAVSLYMIWSSNGPIGKRLAMLAFACQILLNVAWSAVFFGLRSPAGGFFVIILLIMAIIATLRLFARISATSAVLLMPYLAWVCFAAYLNYQLWILNN